jgi:YD repeat-containing protein
MKYLSEDMEEMLNFSRVIVIVIVVDLLLFTTTYASGVGKSDRENDGLKGVVKTLRIDVENYTDQAGQWIKQNRLDVLYKMYDEKGYLLENTPAPSVTAPLKLAHRYDVEGRVIESKVLAPNSAKTTFTYKSIGDITEKHSLVGNHPTSDRIDVYDKNNRLLAIKVRENGSTRTIETYSYDSQGRILKRDTYDAIGKVMYRSICDYDAEGRVKQCINSGPNEGRVVHDYPTQDTETQTIYNADGMITSKTTYSYENDNNGNWIKEVELTKYFGDRQYETKKIFYRTITYYPSHYDQ